MVISIRRGQELRICKVCDKKFSISKKNKIRLKCNDCKNHKAKGVCRIENYGTIKLYVGETIIIK